MKKWIPVISIVVVLAAAAMLMMPSNAVANSAISMNPYTGDTTNLGLLVGIMVGSLVCLVALLVVALIMKNKNKKR